MKRALCLLLVFAMLMPNFTVFAAAEETQPALEETVAAVSETAEIVEETEEIIAETAEETTAEETVVTEAVEETTVVTEPVVETTVVTEPVAETTVATEPVVETTVVTEPVAETTVATEPVVEATAATEPVVETTAATEAVEETVTEEAQVTEEAVQETVAEIPELRQEGTSFYFYTFAQLQQIAAGTYEEWTDAYYEGTENLVITEDLTLPENLVLWAYDTMIQVPENVTLTVVKRMDVGRMTVDGTVCVKNEIHVGTELTVNGAVYVDNYISFSAGAALNGREKIVFTEEAIGLYWNVTIASTEELYAAVEKVNTEADDWITYNLYIEEPVVLEQSLTIPAKCSLDMSQYAAITVGAGCTLTVDTYFPVQCSVIVEGAIVNNQEFNIHDAGSMTFRNGGTYSGAGYLWVSKSQIEAVEERLIGFDFNGYEVTDLGGEWQVKNVEGLIKLADPTDLQWGTFYQTTYYNEETQRDEYRTTTMPGAWAAKYGDANLGEMTVRVYRAEDGELISSMGHTATSPYQWFSDNNLAFWGLESGSYYFTACVEGDYETYCSSNEVTSPVYVYTKPEAKLDSCTDLTWDGRDVSYRMPADTSYVYAQDIQYYYAAAEGEELQEVSTWDIGYSTEPYCWYLNDNITSQYGPGYYYYRIRLHSSDIEKYCNSDQSELSTAYYFDGTWPEVPETTVPEVTEPEETTTGTCGENLSWTLDEETGLLHIFGTGAMYDYEPGGNTAPWVYKNITDVQIDAGVTSIGNFAFFCCHALKSVQIADSVTKIGADAFHCCCSLTEITLPANLQEMYGAPFLACRELKSIQIAQSNTFFKTVDGVLFTKDGKSLVVYPAGNTRTDYTVPAGVETIGANAFAGSYNLKTVTFPNSVAFVGENAFYNCYNLQQVDLGTNLRQIGPWAFNCCEALKEITIPATVTEIGYLAFGFCSSMSKINFQGNAPQMKETGAGDGEGGTFFNVTAKAYYPVAAKGWSTAKKNYGGTLTWVAYGELQAPTVKVTNRASDGKPSLSWNAVEGAQEYQVWRSTTGKTGSFTRLITVEKTSHVHAKAETGTKYYYKIRAVGADGVQSDFSNTVSRKSDLAQPKIDAFARADNGKIKINWDKVTGAVKYQVYRATAKDGDYTLVKTTTDKSYADNNVTLNKLYYYKVRAVYSDTDCNSAFSEIDSARCILPQPTITLSTVDSSGKVKISWAKIANAANYEDSRTTKKDGSYTRIATTTNLSATDTTGAAGTTYFYKIKAIHSNTNANSAYSAAKSRLVKLAQPVVKASNIAASGKVHLEWAKVEGATGYQIYRATSKTGSYKLMFVSSVNYYNNLFQIDAGKTYYYKVKAVMSSNTDANSIFSEIVSRTCKLEQPEVTVANFVVAYEPTVKNTKDRNVLRVSWKKVSGAAKYEVYRATSKNGTYSRKATTTKLVYDDYDVSVGKTYYYKVKAIHSNSDASSAASEIKSALNKLATPSRVSAGISISGKPYLNLGSVYDASYFYIYRATAKDGTYKKIASVKPGTGPSKTWTDTTSGITPGKTYYYKVKAVKSNNTAVDSGFSSIVSAKARLATPQITSAEMYKKHASLRWNAVSGAVKYEIYRSSAWNDGGYTRVFTTKETNYLSVITHTAGKYHYKVKAIYKDSAGNSALSSSVRPR